MFLKLHQALAILALYCLWQHTGVGWSFNINRTFILITAGLSVAFGIWRCATIIYRNYLWGEPWTSARIVPLEGAAEVVVTLARPWIVQPGQFVRLWTPAAGFWSLWQTHPYSVSWWTEDEEGKATTISLLVKGQSGLTQNLITKSPRTSFVVAIDGPYGQAIDTSRYRTIVLFATGIGIAAQLSVLKQAFYDYARGKNLVRRISVVWQMDSECE